MFEILFSEIRYQICLQNFFFFSRGLLFLPNPTNFALPLSTRHLIELFNPLQFSDKIVEGKKNPKFQVE